jgi:hypothetical protein
MGAVCPAASEDREEQMRAAQIKDEGRHIGWDIPVAAPAGAAVRCCRRNIAVIGFAPGLKVLMAYLLGIKYILSVSL